MYEKESVSPSGVTIDSSSSVFAGRTIASTSTLVTELSDLKWLYAFSVFVSVSYCYICTF